MHLPVVLVAGAALSQDGSPQPRSNHGPSIIGPGSIRTHAGIPTTFSARVIQPDGEFRGIASWDFDGDGVEDWFSSEGATAEHRFERAGAATAIFRAYGESGEILAERAIDVLVLEGSGIPETISPAERESIPMAPREEPGGSGGAACGDPPGDGEMRRHIIIVNGAGEDRFFDDVRYAYRVFHDVLGIPAGDMRVLNYDGTFGTTGNPDGIFLWKATLQNLSVACAQVAAAADGDDMVGIWITDHGHGYFGPVADWPDSPYIGYLDGNASVDPGDEMDVLERDFKLRSFFMGGDYRGDHGMNVWSVFASYRSPTQTWYYRHMYASHFTDVPIADRGLASDGDFYIEEFKDYLACDANKDGIIDTALGEARDCDGDGVPPYNPSTGAFDDGDWGPIDTMSDNVRTINTQVPVGYAPTYSILDLGLDDHVDIDLDHDPAHPEANGTDIDGAGLFDGLDVNDDKDQDDWISIDETFALYQGDVSDDDLRALLEPIHARATYVWMEQCFSGGFIEDLSRPDRILATACEEDTVSYGNRFFRTALSAIGGISFPEAGGDPLQADRNGDGTVDMAEAFTFVAANDYTSERPQYDDDGDGRPHAGPVPSGGDGRFGAHVSAEGLVGTFVRGDGNDDGSIDLSDAVTILLHLFSGLGVRSVDALDYDDGGLVDMADAFAVLDYVFGAGAPPPCPYPWRGIDVTP